MELRYRTSSPEAQGRVMAAVAGAGCSVSSGGNWSSNPTTVYVIGVDETSREALVAVILGADPEARPT